MNYSMEIVQEVRKHLEESDMKLVAFDEEKGVFSFVMSVGTGISFINCLIDVHEDEFLVIARIPVTPYGDDIEVKSSIGMLGEFVCRANYGLKNGCFEMDYRDGELRFKSFVDCEGQVPSQEVIHNSIGVSAAMVRRYSPGILDVLFKGVDPETAVEKCESKNAFHIAELMGMRDELKGMLERLSGTSSEEELEEDLEEEVQSLPSFDSFLSMSDSEECDEEEGDLCTDEENDEEACASA